MNPLKAPSPAPTNAKDAKGAYIRDASGARVFLFDNPARDMNLPAVAHSLSLQCRYGGHCHEFYSVAEHCWLLSDYAESIGEPQLAAALHFHDAFEAVAQDRVGPLKHHIPGDSEYEAYVAESFGLKWPLVRFHAHPRVVALDRRIMTDEFQQNMVGGTYGESWLDPHPLGVALRFWNPKVAEARWLSKARDYLANYPHGIEL